MFIYIPSYNFCICATTHFIKILSTYKYHYRTLNIKDLTKLEYYLYVDSNNNYIKKENIKKY